MNPALGNEAVLPLKSASQAKHVLVVGAGPARLESARVLTERGHRVTVIDESDRLGGTMWFSTMTTPGNERLLRWFKAEIKRLRIAVKLNTPATVETIRALNPDHVIVATGAVPPKPDFPGGDLRIVQTGDTLRAMMLGTATAEETGAVLSTLGKMGRLSGVTKSPEFVRQFTKFWLPMGEGVVSPNPAAGRPLADLRRWTAAKHPDQHHRKHCGMDGARCFSLLYP